MNSRKKSILLLILICFMGMSFRGSAQKSKSPDTKENQVTNTDKDKDLWVFCDAIGKLLSATDDEFVSESGKMIDTTNGMKTWISKLNLPGVKSSFIKDELVISKYYRGRYQNYVSKDSVKMQYDKLSQYLDKCMKNKGYNLQKRPSGRGLKDFEDIIYRLPDDSSIPMEKQPFVKMEVVYEEDAHIYYVAIEVNVSFL